MMWGTIATWPFSLQAVEKAAAVLQKNGTAMDAAEQGIHLVETDLSIESVGRGGWLNADGKLELDAAMMNGDTLEIGAVAGVQHYEHPVSIARAVMEHTRHNMIIGKGAESFACSMGIKAADDTYMIPENIRKIWQQNKENPIGHDTIGIISVDQNGTVVSATSTSGANGKIPGRVGDSPLVGSGFYADSQIGGAAATGLGEDIMRTCCSFRCVQLMASGMTPQQAVETVVRTAHEAILAHGRKPDCIALVCMNKHGQFGAAANHTGFSYAVCTENHPAQIIGVSPLAGCCIDCFVPEINQTVKGEDGI